LASKWGVMLVGQAKSLCHQRNGTTGVASSLRSRGEA
jgi:hypothetical protein